MQKFNTNYKLIFLYIRLIQARNSLTTENPFSANKKCKVLNPLSQVIPVVFISG